MTTGIEQEAIQRRGRGSFTPTYGYYRQPNGWITVSPVTALEELNYRRDGWEPLPQYGRVEMNSEYAADHPLEQLFMFGGAHELPLEQVIQQGLYMYRPLVPTCRQALSQDHKRHNDTCFVGAKPVVFPQLADATDLGPFACRFCDAEKPTVEARDQHETVAHKEEKGDVRTGEALASALVKGLSASGAIAQPQSVAPAAPERESTVLSVLQNVGLNKTQLRALQAAGLIEGDADGAEAEE